MVKKNKQRKSEGSIRIVGGRWRGRRLSVLDRPGLRPTGDRQRETLFNWLQGELHDTACLDLFAGTGVLGIEALSRGAGSLQSVELDRQAANQLQQNVEALEARAEVHTVDCFDFLSTNNQRFGLVFLDPPFALNLLPQVVALIDRHLLEKAWVYVEDDVAHSEPAWPANWQCLKEKSSSGTVIRLFRRVA